MNIFKKIVILVFVLNIFIYLFLFSEYKATYFNIDTGESVSVKKIYCFAIIKISSNNRIFRAYNFFNLYRKGNRLIKISDKSIMGGYQCQSIETVHKIFSYLKNNNIIQQDTFNKIRDSASEKFYTRVYDLDWWYIPIIWKEDNDDGLKQKYELPM